MLDRQRYGWKPNRFASDDHSHTYIHGVPGRACSQRRVFSEARVLRGACSQEARVLKRRVFFVVADYRQDVRANYHPSSTGSNLHLHIMED